MIYVQFDSMLAEYKLCCVLDLFDLDAQKNDCMHEIISCSETHFNNTFSPKIIFFVRMNFNFVVLIAVFLHFLIFLFVFIAIFGSNNYTDSFLA